MFSRVTAISRDQSELVRPALEQRGYKVYAIEADPDAPLLPPTMESVAYLVCGRIGIECPSEQYLTDYFEDNPAVSNISIHTIMKAAGLIAQMGRERMGLREKTGAVRALH